MFSHSVIPDVLSHSHTHSHMSDHIAHSLTHSCHPCCSHKVISTHTSDYSHTTCAPTHSHTQVISSHILCSFSYPWRSLTLLTHSHMSGHMCSHSLHSCHPWCSLTHTHSLLSYEWSHRTSCAPTHYYSLTHVIPDVLLTHSYTQLVLSLTPLTHSCHPWCSLIRVISHTLTHTSGHTHSHTQVISHTSHPITHLVLPIIHTHSLTHVIPDVLSFTPLTPLIRTTSLILTHKSYLLFSHSLYSLHPSHLTHTHSHEWSHSLHSHNLCSQSFTLTHSTLTHNFTQHTPVTTLTHSHPSHNLCSQSFTLTHSCHPWCSLTQLHSHSHTLSLTPTTSQSLTHSFPHSIPINPHSPRTAAPTPPNP